MNLDRLFISLYVVGAVVLAGFIMRITMQLRRGVPLPSVGPHGAANDADAVEYQQVVTESLRERRRFLAFVLLGYIGLAVAKWLTLE